MVALVSTAAVWLACATALPPLVVHENAFKDAAGRTVVLRGMNVAGDSKVPPFMPLTDDHLFDPLPRLGVNSVRLLFTWEAFEPQRGQYSAAYLDYYAQAARWAHERGLYVIVDFHQDAMSRHLLHGCGEGFPEWTLPDDVTHYPPDNGANCSKWYARMWFDRDLRRAWAAFYHDENGVRQAYIDMVRRVAERMASQGGIIGYDLLNEPVGDEVRDIAPLYDDAGAAIREKHPDAILFLEPHVRTDIGLQSHLPKPSFTNIAYAPHFYDAFSTMAHAYLGASFGAAYDNMRHKARDLDAALFIGEYGTSPALFNAPGYMRATLDRMDDHLLSGAQWSYTPGWTAAAKDGWNVEDLSIVDAQGKLRDNFLLRPYAQKVAGLAAQQRFAERGGHLEYVLRWHHQTHRGATEIYVPPADLGRDGTAWRLDALGDGVRCSQRDHILSCEASASELATVTLVN